MDPFSVLGVSRSASDAELASAYRELAKQWHPDRAGDQGVARMAEINVAYELLRAGAQHERGAPAGPRPRPGRAPGGGARGAWLPAAFRRALGLELLEALSEGEGVRLVTPASTWASPRTILAVTERRLLWLLDDAPLARVRTLALCDVVSVDQRVRRPRKVATLSIRTTAGRRHSFAELRPHTAAAIERHLREAGGVTAGRG